MTHDNRLATLEEVMNGNPFDLIDSPFSESKMERWRASTMATGTMGMLKNVYDIVRADAAEAAARADADTARVALLQDILEKLDAVSARCDALASENAALKAKARDDEARKAKFDEELTLPPDLQEYQTENPPAEIGDETHHPGGDLHTVAAKEEPELEELEAEDNVGDLPEEIQLPKPLSEPAPEPKGSVQQQPISVSLNEG